jgi:Abortive infection alpha
MSDQSDRDDGPRAELAPEEDEPSLLRALPGMARIAAAAYWRSARWTVRASAEATERVLRAAVNGQEPAELFRSTGAEVRERTRRVLGIQESPAEQAVVAADASEAEREEARRSLRERGEELLRRSRDVNFEEEAHPAYMRILEDMAPDEARILRLLADHGPQPSVDVRAGLLPLQSTSELVASGLTLIGAEAGCRHLEDVPAYLNNLFRLGLIWFSREPVRDQKRYQVLEAQPDVDAALKKTSHSRTVRRSIHLTPFGQDFCELCLPSEAGEPDAGEDRDPPG